MSTSALAFDASSARTVDENGFLHVTSSHITKATVNPYYGREIPAGRRPGLIRRRFITACETRANCKSRSGHGKVCPCTSSTISTARTSPAS